MSRESTWPTPVSIACFVVGGLSAILCLFGLASPIFQGLMGSMDQTGAARASMATAEKYTAYTLVSSALGLCFAVLALFVGYTILTRRPTAPRLARLYSILQLIYAAIAITLSWQIQQEIFRSMQGGNTATLPPGFGTMMRVGQIFGLLFWGLLYGLLPLFLLVWFARSSIRRDVASWR